MYNIVSLLGELCQKRFGLNIETRVVSVTGPPHTPTVLIEIKLPNDKVYKATGSNKKEAKQRAASMALVEFGYYEEELKELWGIETLH